MEQRCVVQLRQGLCCGRCTQQRQAGREVERGGLEQFHQELRGRFRGREELRSTGRYAEGGGREKTLVETEGEDFARQKVMGMRAVNTGERARGTKYLKQSIVPLYSIML